MNSIKVDFREVLKTDLNFFKIGLKFEFSCAYWLIVAYRKREITFGQPASF
jgi:hypothetical protein